MFLGYSMAENLHNRLGNRDQKTFSDLPMEIIVEIVENLDFKSQARLRKVSSGLRNIVDRVKPSIDRLSFIHQYERSQNSVIFTYSSRKHGVFYRYHRYSGENCVERAFNDMKILLGNPRLRLDDFEWINYMSFDIDHRLIHILRSLDHKLEISSLGASMINEYWMIDLLKAIKPGTLEEMDLKFSDKKMSFDRFAELDQWKQAKRVTISFSFDFPSNFHHFQHFESVQFHGASISIDDLSIIRNVMSSNRNLKKCFIVTVKKPSATEVIQALGLQIMTENIDNQKNMDLNQKTFSDLPLDIVANMVEGLDFKSQMKLRKVSHGLRNIVDRVKPSVDRLSFLQEYDLSQNSVTFTYSSREHSDLYCVPRYFGENYSERAFNDIKIFLRNPRLRLDDFGWYRFESTNDDQKVVDMLNSMNRKIETTGIRMISLREELMIALLKAVKPGTLEEITISIGNPMSLIDRFAELDQWKQAKRMNIVGYYINFFFRHFQHFHHSESLNVDVKEISMDDILNMRNTTKMAENLHNRLGNLKLNQKTFNDLPLDIVASIVEGLDFKSQMQLRKVCRGLRNIVDQVKPSIDHLSFVHQGLRCLVKISQFGEICQTHRYSGENFYERALNDIKILLRNPRLRLNSFEWHNSHSFHDDRELLDLLESLNHKLEITEIKALLLNEESMIALLKAVKPGTLEQITILACYSLSAIDRFAELDQWKQAKTMKIHGYYSDFFRHFHHYQRFESLSLLADSIPIDGILAMRNAYSKNFNFKNFFIIGHIDQPPSVMKEHLGLSNALNHSDTDSGRYDIPGSKDYLLFEFYFHKIFVRRESSDKMQLRRVSRGLRNIVDRVKPSVDCLRISHDQDSVTITYSVKKHKRSSFSYSGEKYYEKALNDMKILLKNPRLRLESFHWRGTLESEDFLESLQLEVTELSTYHLPRDSVVALLSAIKPGALKALDFKFSTDLKKFDRFAELDQWKQAKRVRIRSLFEDFFGYFHYFQHFEMVSVRVKEISMDDLVIMRNKNPIQMSEFVKKVFVESGGEEKKTFSDLSFHVIGNIVEMLDIESQCRLRRVCHGLRQIVDLRRPSIHSLVLTPELLEIVPIDRPGLSYCRGSEEERIQDYCRFLRNPRIRLGSLTFHGPEKPNKIPLTPGIRVKKLRLVSATDPSEFLGSTRPGTLETIILSGIESIDRLVSMDQWKKAKEVSIDGVFIDYSPHFHHFQNFNIWITRITVEELVELKNNLSENPDFEQCCLKIDEWMPSEVIEKALNLTHIWLETYTITDGTMRFGIIPPLLIIWKITNVLRSLMG
uniref:F-box domain-containing protein n=1 Tax=Caenorhabditis tropicalis TaxID=1561998 RepID=A0A1I7UI95_9PELO